MSHSVSTFIIGPQPFRLKLSGSSYLSGHTGSPQAFLTNEIDRTSGSPLPCSMSYEGVNMLVWHE